MAQAKNGDTVRVHYTCTLEDGTIVGSTLKQEPLQFTIGNGQVISGIEEAVTGMEEGETKDTVIPNGKAFGPHKEEMIKVVDKDKLPADLKLEVGMNLQVKDKLGQTTVMKVTDVAESSVTLDFNHPLSGKDLIFNIQLLKVI
jgi:peptidylprolyl isomerase